MQAPNSLNATSGMAILVLDIAQRPVAVLAEYH